MHENASHKLWHRRRYLPHFDGGAVIQAITFRLDDSLPRAVYDALVASEKKLAQRYRRLEAMVDEGRGSCLLADPIFATIVQDALQHFDGDRYRLIAWVLMPNHVHALIEQVEGHRLGDIVRSWKRFTANRINERRATSGPVWAVDYFDRYVRNAAHFANAVRYIEGNPVKAGLACEPEDWVHSSAYAGTRQSK